MVPPIRLWDAGVPNRAALAIMTRNSRMPESAGRRPRRRVLGLPDGRAPARRAVRPVRRRRPSSPASTRSSTAPPRPTAARSSARSRSARGCGRTTPSTTASTSRWLHTQRITLTRTAADDPDGERLVLDFDGTVAAGQGADQPLRRLQRRRVPQEVAGADPAQPRRHPRADGRARRQRGRRTPHRDAVPAARHAAHAGLPGADQRPHVRDPAAARRAGRRGRQGRRRPDAGRPGDDPLHRRVRRGPRGPART